MRVDTLPDLAAIVLTPEEGDRPEELEDRIHDQLVQARPQGETWARSSIRLVVLDYSQLDDASFGRWMKAAGPAIPDADLRVVVSEPRLRVARRLGLTFHYEWFATREAALSPG